MNPAHRHELHHGSLEKEEHLSGWKQEQRSLLEVAHGLLLRPTGASPEALRDYYGTHIGMYFAFLESLAESMIRGPAGPGLLAFLVRLLAHRVLSPEPADWAQAGADLMLCLFLPGWSCYFCLRWKRRQSLLALKWGHWAGGPDAEMEAAREPDLANFHGQRDWDPVSGAPRETFSPRLRRFRTALGFLALLAVLGGNVVVLVALGHAPDLLKGRGESSDNHFGGFLFWQVLLACVRFSTILGFRNLGNLVAVHATNYENHRTRLEYNDALVLKVFLSAYLNKFWIFFYLAFLKATVEGCEEGAAPSAAAASHGLACEDELAVQLTTIFCIEFCGNFVELGKPALLFLVAHSPLAHAWTRQVPILAQSQLGRTLSKVHDLTHHQDAGARRQANTAREKGEKFDLARQRRFWVEDLVARHLHQAEYGKFPGIASTQVDGTLDDFLELLTLFGYVSFFGVVFPLAPFLGALIARCEYAVDAVKLYHLHRRPFPISSPRLRWTSAPPGCRRGT